jgi:hypothetical protein
MDEQRLRALASAASIGPWSVHGNNCDEWYVYALHARYETLPGNPSPVKVAWVPWSPGTLRHEHDAAYIAAASPDAVLALLDALDAVERERDEARRHHAENTRLIEKERGRVIDTLRAERNALAALLRDVKVAREGHYWTQALTDRIDAALDGAKGAT